MNRKNFLTQTRKISRFRDGEMICYQFFACSCGLFKAIFVEQLPYLVAVLCCLFSAMDVILKLVITNHCFIITWSLVIVISYITTTSLSNYQYSYLTTTLHIAYQHCYLTTTVYLVLWLWLYNRCSVTTTWCMDVLSDVRQPPRLLHSTDVTRQQHIRNILYSHIS